MMSGMAVESGSFQSAIIMARRTLLKTICDPIERSMPPLIITNIKPTALIPAKEICRTRVRMFPKVMKFGAMNENRTNKNTRITKGTFFFITAAILPPRLFKTSERLFIQLPSGD